MIIVTFILFCTVAFLLNYIVSDTVKTNEQVIEVEKIREKHRYEKVLTQIVKDFETLKVFVEITGTDNLSNEAFHDFTEGNYISDDTYFSYSIAPDGIVEYYHSSYTNEDIIGHNLLTDERVTVRNAINYAIANDVYAVTGPVDLILGEKGIVFRRAIFEDGEFKAIISLVIYYDVIAEMFNAQSSDVIDVTIYNDKNHIVFGEMAYTEYLEMSEIDIDGIDWRLGLKVSESHTADVNQQIIVTLVTGNILYFIFLAISVFIYHSNYQLLIKQNQLINYDKLTNLPNRRLLMSDLKKAIKKERPFYLGFGDLDNFKYLNDLLGHSYGDIFLQTITKQFNNLTDDIFNVYRWGGDEFIFVMYTDQIEVAIDYLEKIYDSLKNPINLKNTKYNALISIGVVNFPDHGQTIDDLIKRADIIMYDIKSEIKNSYRFFQSKYIEDLQLELEFEELVNNYSVEDFDIYLQPLVYTSNNQIYGFEALSRLFDHSNKLIHTEKVIKYLERKGEIQNLEMHIFDKICEYSNIIKKETGFEYMYSFNLSTLTLSNEYIKYLKQTVTKHQVNPSHFIIEITEGLGFKDINSSITLLDQLRNIGFLIAMDDFGIGFSSLSYISKLPLNMIKIDKYFVQNSKESNFESNLLETISNISKSLKLDVIAEGVETKEQLGIIKDLGNLLYQGYLHSKPMSLTHLLDFIKHHKQ